jgi:GT2 family glycosyltransferase
MIVEKNENQPRFNFYPEFNENWLRAGAIISQPTVFMRKRVFEKVGEFSKDVTLIADCEYWLRAVVCSMKFAKVHEILALEYNHGTTLRNTRKNEILSEKHRLLEAYPPASAFRSRIGRVGMMRAKYLEKELLALKFLLQTKWGGVSVEKQPWSNYLSHYKVRSHISRHFAQKITRKTQPVCEILQP